MSGFVVENPDAVGDPDQTPRVRLIDYDDLIAERYGELVDLERERQRKPLPPPTQETK